MYMKATGIVRRIDDLGRVVIPKEIRRTMRIREGAALEIFTDKEGEVIFKKYSPLGELGTYSAQYAESISKVSGLTVAVCDRDTVVAASGAGSKDVAERSISEQASALLESRKPFSAHDGDGYPFLTA
ncbi:MAG: AbrB/MazE/SpoVT family DNA-binding domain-containing protein, partial [Clostridia bacterium]|nr:AbrB/MazE/SpoVT family DNA-binding domain-containing protein [Clostridia bacterium]